MYKKLTICLLVAALAAVHSSSAVAQGSKAADEKAKSTQASQSTTVKPEKPAASPDQVVLEDDWWFPLRDGFTDAANLARDHFRSGEEKSAAEEIEKAISWISYAQSHGNLKTQEDLSTAKSDLQDFAAQLKRGEKPKAQQLESAFAHASAALAKHHYYKSFAALSQDDLKTAGQHLIAAVEDLREASKAASHGPGQGISDIYDYYSPNGHWDETVVFEKNQLESSLKTVDAELKKLATKLENK